MALRGNRSCNSNSCHDHHHHGAGCDTPSSKIFYDGENRPELGLIHGAPLNLVLEKLANYIQTGISASGSVTVENFEGVENVRLQNTPAEILLVTYCGNVLPADAFKMSGKKMLFCKDYCLGDNEFAAVNVVYRVKAENLGFNC